MLVRERHLIIFVRNFRPCGKIGSPLSSIVKSSYAKGSIGMKSRKKYVKKKKKIGKVRKKRRFHLRNARQPTCISSLNFQSIEDDAHWRK